MTMISEYDDGAEIARLTQAGYDLLDLGDTISDHRAVAHLLSVDRDDAATRAVRRKYGIARGLDVDVARRFIVAGECADAEARARNRIKDHVGTLQALLAAWEEKDEENENVIADEEGAMRVPRALKPQRRVWMPDLLRALRIERDEAARLATGTSIQPPVNRKRRGA